ncbi:hypothetical protein C2U70_30225 [Bradyrhizobium guangdongense]|nr:hypothetical protein C2U70_30225 [Bradyrhizobium guangdongense]
MFNGTDVREPLGRHGVALSLYQSQQWKLILQFCAGRVFHGQEPRQIFFLSGVMDEGERKWRRRIELLENTLEDLTTGSGKAVRKAEMSGEAIGKGWEVVGKDWGSGGEAVENGRGSGGAELGKQWRRTGEGAGR